MPDFFAALYAAVCYVRDGDVTEAEITDEFQMGEGVRTLTVSVRRFDSTPLEEPAEEVAE